MHQADNLRVSKARDQAPEFTLRQALDFLYLKGINRPAQGIATR